MLSKVLFYLVIKPLSLLPLRALYPLASFAYFILYKLIGYRTDVVSTNIANSFPEKSAAEQKQIMSDFYHYVAELMVETVWMFSISEKRIRQRFTVENPELVDAYFDQERSIIIILAHYSCWEVVLSALNLFIKHKSETIYIPLTNKEFDRQFLKMRTRFDSGMIPKRYFKDSFNENTSLRAVIFGADQSPSISKNLHWTTFLNQDTAVAKGAEKYAKAYDMPVIYAQLMPVGRGKFNLRFELITNTPKETPEGWITDQHVKMLERQIRENPAYWLWSHRRWKKKRSTSD